MDQLHWRHLLAKLLATTTITLGSVTSVFPCLCCLGRFDGQSKYIQRDIAGVIVRNIALNIANVKSTLKRFFLFYLQIDEFKLKFLVRDVNHL
jgi:hypothetical protein